MAEFTAFSDFNLLFKATVIECGLANPGPIFFIPYNFYWYFPNGLRMCIIFFQ